MQKMLSFVLLSLIWIGSLSAQEVDTTAVKIIKKHGLEKSQVMDIASWITDVYGPRLTGSVQLDQAIGWAKGRLNEMGLQNVHTEEWGPFGRAWSFTRFSIHADFEHSSFPIIGVPKAWSQPIDGKAEAILVDIRTEEDFIKYKGKLKGKIVLIDTMRTVTEWFEAPAKRRDAADLLGLANQPTPAERGAGMRGFTGNRMNEMRWQFLYEEEPLAILDRSFKGDLGVVFSGGARAKNGMPQKVESGDIIPQATISVEHYNRILRLLAKGIPVQIEMKLDCTFINENRMQQNIIAEIPGSDKADEVVMIGAHFDSWHLATGATDNGAGSAVMMEAMRILQETFKESNKTPRRTIRLALWTGEEQGLFGSIAYVQQHYAVGGGRTGPVTELKPEQEKISAYYNLDNGTGKIRGVYLQGNQGVAPIFRAWLDPFKDLEATTLTLSNTGGTDHLAFDAAGIPGFQFIQDPIAYSTRTHHSNMDNYDHLVPDDLKQAATIIASFAYHTAMREERMPRKPFRIGQ